MDNLLIVNLLMVLLRQDIKYNFLFNIMESPLEYTPLKWPPSIELAQIHFNSCQPGIQNPDGNKCPCCGRQQKLQNNNWGNRNITKDYRNYGGGVLGYFYIMVYCMIAFLCLFVVLALYHIYVLQKTCPLIQQSGEPRQNHCTKVLGDAFKCCDNTILFNVLNKNGKGTEAIILQSLQFASYIILVVVTLCIRLYLQSINKEQISQDDKIYCKFSLIIKGVPVYYQLDDLLKEFKSIDPNVQVIEIFYLHRMCDYDDSYRKLFDMYFEINSLEDRLKTDDRTFKIQDLRAKYQEYLKVYDLTSELSENQKKPTKKVIVLFNTIEQKEAIHKHLKMNQMAKFWHYAAKMSGCEHNPITYYSEKLTQPQEIHWKYIGQSSTSKQKARVMTTVYGALIIIIAYLIFYYPMVKIDELKTDPGGLGSGLGILMSIVMIVMSIGYRLIILRIMPSRKPSNKITESYFIVMTTIIFHFFFYLITPATFYIFAPIYDNLKLKVLFMAVFVFMIMTVIVAALDIRYNLFRMRRNKLLGQKSLANVFCQQRLHEMVTPPSFPIEFKLMVIYDVWAFNSFYIFQMPELLIFFLIGMFIIFWIDKHNIYNHYKMQYFLSIDLQLQVQKAYCVIFLICVSLGYLVVTQYVWERWIILAVFIIGIIINETINYRYKQQRDRIIKHDTNLKTALGEHKAMKVASFHQDLIDQQMKSSLIMGGEKFQFSSVSIASEIYMYGYQETYNMYLRQFKNKEISNMLQERYLTIKNSKTVLDGRKRSQSEMARIGIEENQLNEQLIAKQDKGEPLTNEKANSGAEKQEKQQTYEAVKIQKQQENSDEDIARRK